MKKSFYLLAVTLIVVTTTVFANYKYFITDPLYASTSSTTPTLGNSTQLTSSANLVGFIDTPTGSGQQAEIKNQAGNTFFVYSFNGSSFTKMYSNGW